MEFTLVNKCEVGEINAQVGDAWRVASGQDIDVEIDIYFDIDVEIDINIDIDVDIDIDFYIDV